MTGSRTLFNLVMAVAIAVSATSPAEARARNCDRPRLARAAVIAGGYAAGETVALAARHNDWWTTPTRNFYVGWGGSPSKGQDGFLHGGIHGPLLVGAITGSYTERWNSVLAIDRGRITGIADKVHLITFSEEVPFWDELPPLQQLVPRGLSRGDVASDVLEVAGTRVGVLNCFEDLVPEHARAITALGANLLSNHTNDAWFGDTYAPHLHRFLSVMRSVETRRDMVRVVGTGPSGLTNAVGERDLGTRTFVATRRIVEARLLDRITPWVRYGDLVTWPALTLLAAFAFARRRAC